MAKVHLRLWARATMRDIISLQFWLLAAALATFTLFSLVYQSLEWTGLRMALISYLFTAIGVCLPRLALDLFRDFGLEARHRNPIGSLGGTSEPVVVMGAGNLGTLLLDHLKSSNHDDYANMRVMGYLDEEKALHGRRIRSFQILGDLSVIPGLVESHGLKGIVLAIKQPRQKLLQELEQLSIKYNLRIYHWKVGILPMTSGSIDSAQSNETISTQSEPESAVENASGSNDLSAKP
jgi:FlaA1/EpsC-like NDP-sugar epimerase